MTAQDAAYQQAVTEGSGSAAFATAYYRRLGEILGAIDAGAVAELVAILAEARKRDACIWFIGNGGMAAVASEWANDLGIETGMRFRAVSLSENVAAMTAVANDENFDLIFVRQIESVVRRGDVVVGMSGSGDSDNIVAGLKAAAHLGAITVGLTGERGGAMSGAVYHEVNLGTDCDECGLVQDANMAIMHSVVNWFMRLNRGA